MRYKILPRISLIIGFVLLFFLVKYQGQLKDFWSFFIDKVSIYSDNYFFPSGKTPERKRPVALMERETELVLYIGDPFKEFTAEDWETFWNMMYGGFQKEESGENMPRKMRQLTEEEIKNELSSRYPQPFSYFSDQHWKILFGIVFKK